MTLRAQVACSVCPSSVRMWEPLGCVNPNAAGLPRISRSARASYRAPGILPPYFVARGFRAFGVPACREVPHPLLGELGN
jgi:hypothetical protein